MERMPWRQGKQHRQRVRGGKVRGGGGDSQLNSTNNTDNTDHSTKILKSEYYNTNVLYTNRVVPRAT